MITLIPIDPLDEGHGALIVEAFGRLLIDGGGVSGGSGDGFGASGPLPDEWRVDTHAIPCKP